MTALPEPEDRQPFLPGFAVPKPGRRAATRRRASLFLRNQFAGVGKFGIPLVRKERIPVDCVNLIACTNTVADDTEYFDFGVHFFVDDYLFGHIYDNPEKTRAIYAQYAFVCTPDFSLYREMPLWKQLDSVARNRWCGAWWQAHGMRVVPTISWSGYQSFEFCFAGVESGSVVAVSTYGCRRMRRDFLAGYDAMLERINPEAVICYGQPFCEMRGNVIAIPVCHPRCFHR